MAGNVVGSPGDIRQLCCVRDEDEHEGGCIPASLPPTPKQFLEQKQKHQNRHGACVRAHGNGDAVTTLVNLLDQVLVWVPKILFLFNWC
jgi:hypothetical protein